MPLYYPAAQGKPDTGSRIFPAAVKALKDAKYPFEVLLFYTYSVVAYRKQPFTIVLFYSHMHFRCAFSPELDTIANQVLKKLRNL